MTSKNSSGGETPLSEMADTANLKAIAFLTVAMTAFAFDDMFIKLASAELGAGQILSIQSLLALFYFAWLARAKGQRITRDAVFSRAILLRNAGEATGAVCFVIALSLMPISNASAILQAAPLAVTLGAALILREAVGWRRWIAVLAGFAGILLMVKPGLAGFNAASLFAVAAVFGLALRDIFTRTVPRSIPTEIIALMSNMAVLVASVILQTATSPWSWMSPYATAMVLCASFFGVIAIHLVTIALRIGEISVIAPFRYVRIVIAIGIGMVVFRERPDMYTWAGICLVVASGLYTLYREQIAGHRKRNDP